MSLTSNSLVRVQEKFAKLSRSDRNCSSGWPQLLVLLDELLARNFYNHPLTSHHTRTTSHNTSGRCLEKTDYISSHIHTTVCATMNNWATVTHPAQKQYRLAWHVHRQDRWSLQQVTGTAQNIIAIYRASVISERCGAWLDSSSFSSILLSLTQWTDTYVINRKSAACQNGALGQRKSGGNFEGNFSIFQPIFPCVCL